MVKEESTFEITFIIPKSALNLTRQNITRINLREPYKKQTKFYLLSN
jgi:hypothetical protein